VWGKSGVLRLYPLLWVVDMTVGVIKERENDNAHQNKPGRYFNKESDLQNRGSSFYFGSLACTRLISLDS